MLNQVAVEALYSATYVETYLDSVENLPNDVQRYLSRIREIDVQYRAHLRDIDFHYEQWSNCASSELELPNASKRYRAMTRIQQCLISAQELGDEKLQIVTQLQELIDHKTRQLDHDFKNLDYGKDEPAIETSYKEPRVQSPPIASPVTATNPVQQIYTPPAAIIISTAAINTSNERTSTNNSTNNINSNTSNINNERSSKRARRTRTETGVAVDISGNTEAIVNTEPQVKPPVAQSTTAVQKKNANTGKKKKRKTRNTQSGNNNQTATRDNRNDTPPVEEPIDPDEPTYCLCDQISFGEMILCDNDLCPIEWFHFSCVSLMSKPKGKWFCPNCRGDRPNVMKPKAQFLKELERYNKEKEEKT